MRAVERILEDEQSIEDFSHPVQPNKHSSTLEKLNQAEYGLK